MKVLIVEDETSSYQNLKAILAETYPEMEVVGNTESVESTVEWLTTQPRPDLILMDVHLSDGSAFEIFNQMEVDVPIIFTTAYDQYALEAFKVNSIDYLLKPVKTIDVKRAIEKFHRLTSADVTGYLSRMLRLTPAPQYVSTLLIPHRGTLLPVSTNDISYIYTTDKNTVVCLTDGQQHLYPKSLEALKTLLPPHQFFRANKQFIVNRNSVKNITVWFDNRLLLTLNIQTPEQLFVSKNKAAEFKEWMTN
ncbi:MAG: response regulator transcription factor [Bacteroidaceae bacterium]|nr:response regulator transcription factor [Bacteroidaceae bacterium]